MLGLTWVQTEDILRHELWQSAAEGRDVDAIRDRWAAAGGVVAPPHGGRSSQPATPQLRALASALLDELARLPDVTAADEPSDWAAIADTLGPVPELRNATPLDGDRVTGAWLGRAVGCLLGKPVEKIPRRGIEAILRSTGRWPLDRYFTAEELDPAVAARYPWNRASRTTSLEENIDGMPEDDDLNYTLMALRIVERHGRDFTADDVAKAWLMDLPAGRVFTAERAAYRNMLEGFSPPDTALIRNPYREWIGAQIRTDLYGWVNRGRPLVAAEWAWRDATVSHTRNGIYGAMFVAAMAATALCADDVETVLEVAASVIPPRSRMARAISFGRNLGRSGVDPATAYDRLETEFDGMHWVHSLNNTALICYALSAAGDNFGHAISLAVMAGWDTDSSAATVGAVLGALGGQSRISPYWKDRLKDRLASSIPGCDGLSFTDLAERTAACATLVGESAHAGVHASDCPI